MFAQLKYESPTKAEDACVSFTICYAVCSKDFLKFNFGGRGYQDQLHDSIAKTKELAGVKVELLTLRQEQGVAETVPREQQVVWVTHNFAFLGGSLGCAEGEKITRAFEYATQHKVKTALWLCGRHHCTPLSILILTLALCMLPLTMCLRMRSCPSAYSVAQEALACRKVPPVSCRWLRCVQAMGVCVDRF